MIDKELIAEKLGMGTRSLLHIFENKELCERLMNETPIRMEVFSKKYGLSLHFLKNLVKEGAISSFGNLPGRRGSPIYIFENETLSSVRPAFYRDGRLTSVFYNEGMKLILRISKKFLTGRQYDILKMIYSDGCSFKDVADTMQLTVQRILQLHIKAMKKIETLPILENKYDDLMQKYRELKGEMEYMDELIKAKSVASKIKYEKSQVKELRNLLNTKIIDSGVSVRVANCFQACDIFTLGDLVRYKRHNLLKFRNFGKNSLKEVDGLLSGMGLTYEMNIQP